MDSSDIRILIVDDDPDILFATTRLLKNEGYVALGAGTGSECLEKTAQEHPDLILLDVQLPDISGTEVCLELKKNPDHLKKYIMMMSGIKISSEDQADGLDVGADGYIARPISNRELLSRVAAMVRLIRAERKNDLYVSELKQAIEKNIQSTNSLRDSEIELENLLQTIQAGVVVHDVEKDKVKKFNRTALKILGLKEEQLLGKSTAEPGWGFIGENGETLTTEEYPVNIVKKTRKPLIDYIIGITHASEQEPTWVIIKATPQFDRSGELTEIIVSSMDITDLRNTRDLLRQKDRQLLQAQKLEAIGILAGGIAHDFNNILAAIIGYSEMIQSDCPTGSIMRNDIDNVVKASHRARELVKQILAFSRQAETDEIILKPALIVKEVLKMLRASLPTTIEIQQNIEPQTGLIFADPTQIHQIITNLCTNAFHAMEETGGTINISLKNKKLALTDLVSEPHVQPGRFIEISVGDTGPGIAPEIMGKIFDPFFTTKEVGKGTGMGLAIIHGIAKKHGGFVSCKSSPGEGTTFHVYFPVQSVTASPEAESISLEFSQTGVERILFIDDEEMLAEMGRTMLERLGYRVTAETNSIEALKTIQSQPDRFDLVITDQTMPGMTGIDLARRILQIRPGLPIILCTGFSNQISEEKARIYGIKGFAMKPLSKKDLATLIRKVLAGEK